MAVSKARISKEKNWLEKLCFLKVNRFDWSVGGRVTTTFWKAWSLIINDWKKQSSRDHIGFFGIQTFADDGMSWQLCTFFFVCCFFWEAPWQRKEIRNFIFLFFTVLTLFQTVLLMLSFWNHGLFPPHFFNLVQQEMQWLDWLLCTHWGEKCVALPGASWEGGLSLCK